MGFFNFNSRLMRLLSGCADLIILNILTLLCSIPIVTSGAALSAMHYVLLRIHRDECSSIVRSFFHAFRQNLWQGIMLSLIGLLLFVILFLDYAFGSRTMSALHLIVYLIPFFSVASVACMTWSIVFLSRYKNTILGILKMALAAGIAHPIYTLIMSVLTALPVILICISAQLLTIVLVLGIALCGYLQTMVYDKILKKLEQPEDKT